MVDEKLCITCQKLPRKPGYTHCELCLETARNWARQQAKILADFLAVATTPSGESWDDFKKLRYVRKPRTKRAF